jgi:hypothetical protein
MRRTRGQIWYARRGGQGLLMSASWQRSRSYRARPSFPPDTRRRHTRTGRCPSCQVTVQPSLSAVKVAGLGLQRQRENVLEIGTGYCRQPLAQGIAAGQAWHCRRCPPRKLWQARIHGHASYAGNVRGRDSGRSARSGLPAAKAAGTLMLAMNSGPGLTSGASILSCIPSCLARTRGLGCGNHRGRLVCRHDER